MKYSRLPLFAVLFYPFVELAAEPAECPVDQLAPYTWGSTNTEKTLQVDADHSAVTRSTAKFSGNVIAKRGQEVFHASTVTYNRDSGVIRSPKQMTYGTPDFAIRAETGHYSTQKESGTFTSLQYYLSKNTVIGDAKQLDVNRKANTEDLTEATYSTCPRLSRAWFIKAKKIHLDHNTGIGESWHTTFHLGEAPIFYFPYFTFPLDDRRKTGFLMPSLNLSETRGLDIVTPYYINIAPNQDATLTPRLMSKRGLMLGAEYRYLLTQWAGTFAGTYLPEDLKDKGKRWSFNTTHQYRPNDRFVLTGSYQRVSDKNYIETFKNTLDLSDPNFVESHLTAKYLLTPNFHLTGEFKNYQVANKAYHQTDRPYSILPRVSAQGRWRFDNNMYLVSQTELTNFTKDNTVSGWRFDQLFSASYSFERTYGFIRPSLLYRFTGYELREQSDGIPASITRSIPTFSLDSGLYFDRQMTWFGHDATQTLEPRLYYLYTPYRDQSDIPDFDTAAIDSSYSAMFLNNRFIGKDRIGDANQLTTAVSTTITDNQSGKELARLSVGQIQYFEDRRVSLLDSVADASRSSVIAEGRLRLNSAWKLRGLVHHDTGRGHTEKSLVGVTYAPAIDKSISLSHLYNQDYYKQVDFAGVWRLNQNWRTFWRWNYSIAYDKTIDVFAGIEYADCCWGVRLLARQKRASLTDNSSPDTSVYLEFALKGLGNIGNDTTALLRNIIPDYRTIRYEQPQ